MDEILLFTIITVSVIGLVAAVILYLVAQKFKVYEDPTIDLVEEVLPGANCGGCGYPGCRNFAEAIVTKKDLTGLYCPAGGNETMNAVAEILGLTAEEKEPSVAVLRCNGTPDKRPYTNIYDGAKSCQIISNLYIGETACPNGCLGCGDCVDVCLFDAIKINPLTKLPEIIDDKCTACEACVKACPRDLIEIRKKNKKDRKIYVSCANTEKGGVARKNCKVACIGCGKCVKICPHDAITLNNNLAYIDSYKCKLCRKCVTECPTNAIVEYNFPPPKEKREEKTKEATA
jgi:Na+-translocating ferredoxin:NAD+ oxidoreductase subunit B